MADLSGLCILCGREATLASTVCEHLFCEPCSAIIFRCPKCERPIGQFRPLNIARSPAGGVTTQAPNRDFSALYGQPNTDVDIIVNQTDKYKCHKIVLQESSRVLRDLAASNPVIVLVLPDTTAFPILMRFLYTNVLPAYLEYYNLISLAKLSNELGTDALSTLVEQRIEAHFHSPAASSADELLSLTIGILPLIHTFGNQTTINAVVHFAAQNAASLFRHPSAITLPESTLVAILSSPKLRVGTRRQLERFLHTWLGNNNHSEAILRLKNSNEFLASAKQDPFGLAATVVCFFADGSERFTSMTITAIQTFLLKTPAVAVGVIVPHNDNATRQKIAQAIPHSHSHRVLYRYANPVPYFANWNPTQYKMDIAQYTEEYLGFDNVFWMDSDTLTSGDLSSFLSRFTSQSEKLFYFTPDHVMHDPIFLQRWRDLFHTSVMVPQACVMGFKSSVIPAYFEVWRNHWREFIEPEPFARLPDPRPHFAGSAFCTEQYAMGLSLNHNDWFSFVMVFDRRMVLVPSQYGPAGGNLVTLQADSPHGTAGGTTAGMLISAITELELSRAMANISLSTSISSSLPLGFKLKPGDVVADMFGGAVIHSYNQQYTQVLQWFNATHPPSPSTL